MDNHRKTNGKSKISAVRNKKKYKCKREDNIPISAFNLYIKLYCTKRKGKKTSKNAMVDAINSWLMLSEHNKQQYQNKYKEYCEKYLQRIVNCMDKAELFMKRKIAHRSYSENNSDECIADPQSINNEENLPQTVETLTEDHSTDEVENKTVSDDNVDKDIDMEDFLANTLEIQDGQHNSQYEPLMTLNPEPMPPALKTGKELFQLIKAIDNEKESTWTSLSQKEKYYYGKAVLTLKKDYIQKYRQYLESLTVRELFDYYNKTFH